MSQDPGSVCGVACPRRDRILACSWCTFRYPIKSKVLLSACLFWVSLFLVNLNKMMPPGISITLVSLRCTKENLRLIPSLLAKWAWDTPISWCLGHGWYLFRSLGRPSTVSNTQIAMGLAGGGSWHSRLFGIHCRALCQAQAAVSLGSTLTGLAPYMSNSLAGQH